MRIAALVAASVIAIGMSAAGNSLQAAPLLPQLETNQSLAQQVGWRYRRHCVRWRHICADRWAWGTWRFRRCMRIHGC
jgi:hypothetical protein